MGLPMDPPDIQQYRHRQGANMGQWPVIDLAMDAL